MKIIRAVPGVDLVGCLAGTCTTGEWVAAGIGVLPMPGGKVAVLGRLSAITEDVGVIVFSVRDLLCSARQARGPVIEKWEGIERRSGLLIMLSVVAFCALAIGDQLYGGIALLGGLLGLLVAGVHLAMLAEKSTLALVLAILVAAAGAATAVGYAALPIWLLMGNGMSGTVLVLGFVALWTKRQ